MQLESVAHNRRVQGWLPLLGIGNCVSVAKYGREHVLCCNAAVAARRPANLWQPLCHLGCCTLRVPERSWLYGRIGFVRFLSIVAHSNAGWGGSDVGKPHFERYAAGQRLVADRASLVSSRGEAEVW